MPQAAPGSKKKPKGKTGERSHQDTRWPMWSNGQGQTAEPGCSEHVAEHHPAMAAKERVVLMERRICAGTCCPEALHPLQTKPRGHPWHGDSLLTDPSPADFQLSAFLRILWAKCFTRRLFCSPEGFIGMPGPQAVLTLAQLSERGGINSERRCRGLKHRVISENSPLPR